jgi:hypothetical protein
MGLNLRSAPRVAKSTRVAVLPQGHIVDVVERTDAQWWRIRTKLGGSALEGWVSATYLSPAAEAAVQPATATTATSSAVPAVHLTENRPEVRRDVAGHWAFPLGESDRPRRLSATPDALRAIASYLSPARASHRRYQPRSGLTYCNVFASDFCYLAGVYLPRVWWTGNALLAMGRGEKVVAGWDRTVTECLANSLYLWLDAFGPSFGWSRLNGASEAQARADEGYVAVIVGRRRTRGRPGHVSVVVPQTEVHRASMGPDGTVRVPLQWQAGSRNREDWAEAPWWLDAKFDAFGMWSHP